MSVKLPISSAIAMAVYSFSGSHAAAEAEPNSKSELDTVVVTASRDSDGISTAVLGSSVTVIQPEQLEDRQTRIISDVLRDVPGVSVNRSGAVGGLTQVRIRGTEGNHVLVLIDGIKASDPYYDEFDFATLMADEVARVEVLRGQQSALYGSDAIGGVIHYMTASGKEQPGFRARLEAGSFGTYNGSARFAGASDTVDFAINGGYQTSDGTPTAVNGTRDLGADLGTFSGKVTFDPTENLRIKAVARYSHTKADTNDQNFSASFGTYPYGYVVDSDDYYKNDAFYGLVRGELQSFNDHWLNALTVQTADTKRDGFSGGALSYGDEGTRVKGSYESTLSFGEDKLKQTLTAAVDYERNEAQNTGPGINAAQAAKQEINNTGLVAQYDLNFDDRIGFGAAVRQDKNDHFDDATTYHVQASYRFPIDFRIKGAAGSGIKNPSMTELYGFNPNTFIGNPDLKPEESEGWEIGVEQYLFDKTVLVGVTYFDSTLTDEIFTRFLPGFVSSPANRTTDSTQTGYEFFITARLHSGVGSWGIDVSYTNLDAKENGLEEVRRPPDIGSLNIDWRGLADERLGVNLTVRYNGEVLDNNFTGVGPSRIPLEAYTLVNLGADYQLSKSFQIYARVENLTDEEYQEVYTYRTPGRAEYVGFRMTF